MSSSNEVEISAEVYLMRFLLKPWHEASNNSEGSRVKKSQMSFI